MYENIASVLESVVDAIPDVTAVVQGGVTRTWGELDQRASLLAEHLSSIGVGVDDTVGIALYNSIEYLEAFFAIAKVRGIPVNVNYRYRRPELAYLFADCGARAVVFHDELADEVLPAAAEIDVATIRVTPDDSTAGKSAVFEHIGRSGAGAPRIQRSGDDKLIIYTGGTTGMPKAAVWRQGDQVSAYAYLFTSQGVTTPTTLAEVGRAAAALARKEVGRTVLPACPLMHSTGFHTAMGSLLMGGTVVLAESRSLDPDEIWRLVENHGVTDLSIVGDAFAFPLVEALERAESAGQPYDLTSLRGIFSSGVIWSAVNKAALLERADVTLQDILASTEGGPFGIAETRRGDDIKTARFRLAPHARLLDDDLVDVAPGSGVVGLLAAPGRMPIGYYNDEAKTSATFRDVDGVRYAIPGDRAMLDSEGFLVLLGRDSGVINTGGEKVFAEEVEQVIAAMKGVEDVLVTGVPDPRWGSRVVALVRVAADTRLTVESVWEAVGDELAGYKRPKNVFFVEELRRSPAGKADRTWAKQRAASLVDQLD